jgi:hypothetical protein
MKAALMALVGIVLIMIAIMLANSAGRGFAGGGTRNSNSPGVKIELKIGD